MKVRIMEMTTSATPPEAGRMARRLSMPVRFCTMAFMGMMSSRVTPMPMTPAAKPSMSVSALKTLETSRYDAPMERRMPISFVRSSTEM